MDSETRVEQIRTKSRFKRRKTKIEQIRKLMIQFGISTDDLGEFTPITVSERLAEKRNKKRNKTRKVIDKGGL